MFMWALICEFLKKMLERCSIMTAIMKITAGQKEFNCFRKCPLVSYYNILNSNALVKLFFSEK